MRYKGEKESNMNNFNDFLAKNKDKIRKVTESNTKRNENGVPVITKDDPWRKETEWNTIYKELSLTNER